MINHSPILLQNTSLSYLECVEYLHVYIDANLNWKSHTSNVFIKISRLWHHSVFLKFSS